MPEGSEHRDRTTIEFAGKQDPSLAAASNSAIGWLRRIETTAKAANATLSGTSLKMKEASAGAFSGGMVQRALGWGAAVTAAAAGFESIKGFFEKVAEVGAADHIEATMRKLNVAIKDHADTLGKGTPYIEKQLRLITETAKKMEEYSGYSEAINLNAAVTLAQFGAQANGISTLEKGMNDYLAATVGVNASMEDMQGLSETIGRMIQSGKGKGLAQFGATKEEIALFNKTTDAAKALSIVYTVLERRGKGYAQSQVNSLGGQALLEKAHADKVMEQYNTVFKSVQLGWDRTVNHFLAHALPLGLPTVKAVAGKFTDMETSIKKTMDDLSKPGMAPYWEKWNTDLQKVLADMTGLNTSVGSLTPAAKHFADQMDEAFKWMDKIDHATRSASKWFTNAQDATAAVGVGIRGPDTGAAAIKSQSERDARIADANEKLNKAEQSGTPEDIAKAVANLKNAEKEGTDAQKRLTEQTNLLGGVTKTVTEAMDLLGRATTSAADTLIMGRRGMQAGGGGSNEPLTQYGPGIDWPGHGTPDSDSSKGKGHIKGVEYNLNTPGAQPSAMKYDYATKHYHIQPGGTYRSDQDHQMHRWMDTTGARNPRNEDMYFEKKPGASSRPATGHTFNYHIHADGADKDAVASIKGHLRDATQQMLSDLEKVDMESYRRSFA